MILVVALGSVLSQDVTLNCLYSYSFYNEYMCSLIQIEVLDPTQNVIFAGQHLENHTNEDVELVFIYVSNTPFIIQEMFATFPNLIVLEISFSNLESISIPDTARLEWLDIYGNNINHIEAGAFSSQSSLEYLFLSYNQIQTVDEDAFAGLSELIYLELYYNDVERLEPGTFNPLTNLMIVDIEANFLTSIDDLFSENRQLENIYLEFNRISGIHPSFHVNLRDNLRYLYLFGNNCVSIGFNSFDDEQTWMFMLIALRTCFHNYNGTPAEDKNLGMELRGSLRFFDQFGNLIAIVN